MKLQKQYVLGAILLGTMLSLNSYAAPAENIKEYSIKLREASEAFAKMGREAKGKAEVIAKNEGFQNLSKQLGLDRSEEARIAQAIADGKSYIASALYASMAAREIVKKKNTEVEGLDQGILAITKAASISGKGNASQKDLLLSAGEMRDVGLALQKKADYSVEMLSWSKEDAQVHTDVMKRTLEIYDVTKSTPEEALVQAIMEVTGVDKDGAMKIIKKLRDCA